MPANSNYQRPRKSQSTSRRTTNREGMPYPSNSTMMMTNPLPVGGFIGPVTPPSDVISPDVRAMNSGSLIASSAIRHVRRVSKQAAMNTKKQIWDSNDASIVAAQSAVDQWEAGYNGLRNLLCAVGNSAQGLYGAAKAGVSGLEHGFLLPVRDWVLLPAFGGVEKLTGETIGFLQSPHAQHLAHQSLGLARQVPFVGENILAPSLCIGANVLKKTWEIAQYPIPTRSQVRDSVDFVMTGTKWALTTAGREVNLYIMRADANITRTLSHTRWKVLGSGPYATLDKLNKSDVIDHLCERYFNLVDSVARYELAAHIRAHNRPLYHDLVLTGLLRERGGELTQEDEWLSSHPSYRELESPFLMDEKGLSEVFALWFRLPYRNGKRPRRDTPWIMFDDAERQKLERHYRDMLRKNEKHPTPSAGTESVDEKSIADDPKVIPQRYATSAKWYNYDPENDLLLDQKRHAVSFFPCCPKCRRRHDLFLDVPRTQKQFGELCDTCAHHRAEAPWVDTLLSPPTVVSVYRPTMWRFYGPGDELRRATWFLDTQRHGLQPYSEDAQAVLEDAYLFLKWTTKRRVWDGSILLTVEVPSPDGKEQQLVQFSSLTSATAIGKGLGSAISLFKRRVYRGAHYGKNPIEDPDDDGSVLDGSETSDYLSGVDSESFDRSERSDGSEGSGSDWIDLDTTGTSTAAAAAAALLPENIGNPLSPPRTATPNRKTEYRSRLSTIDDTDFSSSSQQSTTTSTRAGGRVRLYPEDAKRLRLRPPRPVDEHMQLAFSLKVEKTKDSQPFGRKGGNNDDDDDGSGDVDHLVLVVHGIGEMLQAINWFGLSQLPTIVDCCGFMRKNHSEVLEVRFNQLYKKLDGIQLHRRGPGRVEYLPIEWHDSFTIQSQRRLLPSDSPQGPAARNYGINDISLKTVPQLRQFANDNLMDVLFFMCPEHHDLIIDMVVNEMNFVVDRFRKMTGFNGDVSIVGHSLGSIITWDILDNQRGFRESLQRTGRIGFRERPPSPASFDVKETSSDSTTYTRSKIDLSAMSDEDQQPTIEPVTNEKDVESAENPPLTSPAAMKEDNVSDYPQLEFRVDNAFMLGSPIAVFLMIRNQRNPLPPEFKLKGCSQIFNIFHPLDPVAYRIEPLLEPRNAQIEPKIMTHWHGGFRFQYQTKLLWKRIVEETVKTQENVVASLESGMSALGLLDGSDDEENDDDDDYEEEDPMEAPHSVVTGNLNRGQRIDYMLQEKEIESLNVSEYVAALAAHSCYWLEKDLSLFIARQICLRALERDAAQDGCE